MAATVSVTEDQVFVTLRAFLLSVLASGVEVVQGQGNRVPEPVGADFVVMTPIGRQRLATTTTLYTDGFPGTQSRADLASMQLTVQVDIHGPAASDNAHIVGTLWRTDVAAQFFRDAAIGAAPLFNTDPRQQPFVNGEQQVETRWTMDLAIQVDSVVTTGQDFAASLSVQVVNVDAAYPPP